MESSTSNQPSSAIQWWQPVILSAMAGGMAWGIRGQYGHETGAMMAGLLVSATLVFLLCPKASLINAARAIALATVAMGFGGSMTYGQTVGLTHDPALVGHWGALSWGFFGLAIKGAAWIGFCGVFLGMGLSGIRYRWHELLILMLSLIGAYALGVYLLNSPHDPANMSLPLLYFSDHWHWEPETWDKPRFECWGGIWLALLAAIAYAGGYRKDALARNLAFWGILGGALGFPIGQSLQAYHAWNLEGFRQGAWAEIDKHINWWNMMETAFGAIMGAALGLGAWLNRHRINLMNPVDDSFMPEELEGILLALHLTFLIGVEFFAIDFIDYYYDLGLMMGIIPIACIVGGRWWPYLVAYPIILIPIAGKTLRQLSYDTNAIPPEYGWVIYLLIPMALFIAIAIAFIKRPMGEPYGNRYAKITLLTASWMFFLLNFAFFHFPWPWAEWTTRTPNAIIFSVCIVCLTAAVFALNPKAAASSEIS